MNIFYQENLKSGVCTLSEDESKHCAQVLRMQSGDELLIYDGVGGKHLSVLTKVHKKACEFEVIKTELVAKKPFSIHLAIAPTKNTDRMEWMIEKLCEIGVDAVSFIVTKHSERRTMRMERMERKVISAMKQSGTPWKMVLNEMTNFNEFMHQDTAKTKLLAYLGTDLAYPSDIVQPNQSVSILIGPEGDFSPQEIEIAIGNGYSPISLGATTLRTETAGFTACCFVNFINRY